MWTPVRNHLVWHEPWIYVQLPEQEIEYMQMLPEKRYVPVPLFERVHRVYRILKRVALLY